MRRLVHNTLIECVRTCLRPVIRFCMQRSVGLQDLIESAKVIFVELAVQDLKKSAETITYSRISAMSGVHRKDVVRIYREGVVYESASRFSARVIGIWRKDRRFLAKNRHPRVLSVGGEDSQFTRLVRVVSSDIRPASVLFDLERIGAVQRVPDGVKLIWKAYVPRGDPHQGLEMMAEDAEDLMSAVMENVTSAEVKLPNYHAKSIFDNIADKDITKIRGWLLKNCSQFQDRVEKYLQKHDLDINPRIGGQGGARVVVGLFSRTLRD